MSDLLTAFHGAAAALNLSRHTPAAPSAREGLTNLFRWSASPSYFAQARFP